MLSYGMPQQPKSREALAAVNLALAAQQVVDAWEGGDLAASVRNLYRTLKTYNNTMTLESSGATDEQKELAI